MFAANNDSEILLFIWLYAVSAIGLCGVAFIILTMNNTSDNPGFSNESADEHNDALLYAESVHRLLNSETVNTIPEAKVLADLGITQTNLANIEINDEAIE